MNIDGVERKLALFEPPIDPGLLVAAAAKGLSIGNILNDMSSAAPMHRFNVLIQRASEFCNEVKSLGSALQSALANADAEKLSRIRATHETTLMDMMTAVKERQVLEATTSKQALEKSREAAKKRLQYHLGLLGITEFTIPDTPSLATKLTADSALPPDIILADIQPDVRFF